MRARSDGRPSLAISFAACCLCALAGLPVRASAPAGDDPTARGLQLLRARESALESQTAQATATARRRGRMLYRLLLHEAAERRSDASVQESASPSSDVDAQGPGGRAIALGIAVLGRDLHEAAALRDELDRVRVERREAVGAAGASVAGGVATGADGPGKLRAPVAGPIVAPWGVTRDEATGAWLFRAAADYAPAVGVPVIAPADGRVARIADDVGSGRALVLVHAGGLTTVLGGLSTVAVAPHQLVRAGAVVGAAGPAVRVEVSRGRTAVDPASLFLAPAGRVTRGTTTGARPRSPVR